MKLFNSVKVRTPESVELEFTLAGIGNRALALAIDYFIWGVLLFATLVIWRTVSVQIEQYVAYSREVNQWLNAISFLILFFVYTGYFVLFETIWQGQTPGKRIAHIRVIRDDGQPVGAMQAILRALIRPIDDISAIGMLMITFLKREKRMGDFIAGTLVVQEPRVVASANFQVSGEAERAANELLTYQTLNRLLPDDFAVIREYLQRRSMLHEQARNDVSLKLARQVRDLLELKELPFEMTGDLFLEAVYLAYQRQ